MAQKDERFQEIRIARRAGYFTMKRHVFRDAVAAFTHRIGNASQSGIFAHRCGARPLRLSNDRAVHAKFLREPGLAGQLAGRGETAFFDLLLQTTVSDKARGGIFSNMDADETCKIL